MNYEKLTFRILKSKDDARFVRQLEIENQRFIDNDNLSQSLYDLDTDKVDIDIWKQIYILENEYGERLGYGLIRYYPAEREANFTYCIKEASRKKGYGRFLLDNIISTIISSRFADYIKVKVFTNDEDSFNLFYQKRFKFSGKIPGARQLMPDGTMLTQDYFIMYLELY
jgi:ribosomal protein S18 acetylase RimI-like enzyme